MSKTQDIMNCPGAWYGWQPKPGEFDGVGHIVIDPKYTVPAITWLKRKFRIGSTRATTDQGLFIDLRLKA